MSSNPNADAWLESYQIPWGFDPNNTGQKESLASNLRSTNGAAHRAEATAAAVPAAVAADMRGVLRAPEFLLSSANIAAQVLDRETIEYENQPEGQHNTDTIRKSLTSTNGEVYRLSAAVRDLNAKVDAILAALSATPPAAPPAAPQTPPAATYTVKAGDTFNGIAKASGVAPEALRAANPTVANPDDIYVGQVLNLPK